MYAGFRGGTPERIAAAILVVATLASALALGASVHRYMRTEIVTMWVDVAMTAAFLALALRAQRYWPMWVSMVQIDIVATHLVMFSPETQPWSYWAMQALWSYPAPLLLAIGTLRHRQRLKRYGDDPSWSVPA
ncbi:MAG: hypothetical protein ABW023_06400 [Sphingomonas sp.]